MIDICNASLSELLQAHVPRCIAEAIVEGQRHGGPVGWDECLTRLYYTARSQQQQGSIDDERGYATFVPQDQRILQELGVVISTDLRPASPGSGPWWAQPLQHLAPPGCPPDDAFPAEFRGYILDHAASLPAADVRSGRLSSSGIAEQQPTVLPADREMFFTYLFAQMRYSDPVKGVYTYLGYKLSRAVKERMFTRWAREYPELSENVLAAWDVPRDSSTLEASPASQAYYEAQCRKFRSECWAALLRRGAQQPSALSASDPAPPPLPDWLGASGPGLVAGSRIPHDLRDLFRIDPYGNVVACDAEAQSICAWDVDHVFPRKRGGRSVLQNFVATHWYANRHVKTEKLLCTIVLTRDGRNPLTCGLTETGLAQLWSARQLLPASLQTTPAFRQLLIALLCTNWRRGADSKELFNTRIGLLHVTPADQLFVVLLQEFQAATTTLVAGWHVGLLASAALPAIAEQPAAEPTGRRSHHGRTASAFVMPTSPTKPGQVAGRGQRGGQHGDKHSRTNSEGGMPDVDTLGDQMHQEDDRLSSSRVAGAGTSGRHPRSRMGPLPSGQLLAPQGAGKLKPVSQETAFRVFNEVVALAHETDLRELSKLPQIAELSAQGKGTSPRDVQDGQGKAGVRHELGSKAAPVAGDGDKRLSGYAEAARMMGDAFFAQVMQPALPKPVKKVRARMSSAATQTAAGLGDTASSTSTSSSGSQAAAAAEPTSASDKAAVPKSKQLIAAQGAAKNAAQEVKRNEDTTTSTVPEAVVADVPAAPPPPAPVKIPVYSPPHCAIRSVTPPRPRNPLNDPFITEAYDLSGPAAPGSSLTSRGIIQTAVDRVLEPRTVQDKSPHDSNDSSLNNSLQKPHKDGTGEAGAKQGYFWCPGGTDRGPHGGPGLHGAPTGGPLSVNSLHHALNALGQASFPLSMHQQHMLAGWGSAAQQGPKHKKGVLTAQPPAAGQPYILSPGTAKPFSSQSPQAPPPDYEMPAQGSGRTPGYLEERKHKQHVRNTWELAQIGVIAPGPLWAGGPWPVSNPHLGPGKPHPRLIQELETKGKEEQDKNQWLSVQGPAPMTAMQQQHDLSSSAPGVRLGILGPYVVAPGEGDPYLLAHTGPVPQLHTSEPGPQQPAAPSTAHQIPVQAAASIWEQPASNCVPMQLDPAGHPAADYSRLVPSVQPWPSAEYFMQQAVQMGAPYPQPQQYHHEHYAESVQAQFWASPEAAANLSYAVQGNGVASQQQPSYPWHVPQPAAQYTPHQQAADHGQYMQQWQHAQHAQHMDHQPARLPAPTPEDQAWAGQMLRAAVRARSLHRAGQSSSNQATALAGKDEAVRPAAEHDQQQHALQMLRAAMAARQHKQAEAARIGFNQQPVQPSPQLAAPGQGAATQESQQFALQMLQAAMAARAQHQNPGVGTGTGPGQATPSQPTQQGQQQFALQMLQAAMAARAQHQGKPAPASTGPPEGTGNQPQEPDKQQFALHMLQAAMAARKQHAGPRVNTDNAIKASSAVPPQSQPSDLDPQQFALQMLQAAMAARAQHQNPAAAGGDGPAQDQDQQQFALEMLQAAMAARKQPPQVAAASPVPASVVDRQLSRAGSKSLKRASTEGYQQWVEYESPSLHRHEPGKIRYEAVWSRSGGTSPQESLTGALESLDSGFLTPTKATAPTGKSADGTQPRMKSTDGIQTPIKSADGTQPALPPPAWSSPLPTSPLGKPLLSEEDLPPPAFHRAQTPGSGSKKKRSGMKKLSAGAKQAVGKLRALLGINSNSNSSNTQGASEAVLNIGHLPMSLESVAEEEEEVEDQRHLSPTSHAPPSAFATSQKPTSPGRSTSPSKRLLKVATRLVSRLSASKADQADGAGGRPLTKEALHAHGAMTQDHTSPQSSMAAGAAAVEEADQRHSPANSDANPLMQTMRSRGKQATLRASMASLNSSTSSTSRMPSAPGLPQPDSNLAYSAEALHDLLPKPASQARDEEAAGVQAKSRERRSVTRM